MRLKQTSTRATTVFLSLALSLPLLLLALRAAHRPCAPGWSQQLQRDAQAAAAETAALSAAGPPAPFLSPDDVPPGCMRLERVCVDQQMIVMMDERYSAQAVPQLPLPQWAPPNHYNYPWQSAGGNPDIWNEEALLMPPVEFRASGEQEPTPDLQHPVFNSDTLPLLFSSAWQENFAHALGNSAAWLHAHLHIRNVSWVNRTALVVHTPFGMALPALWQPLVGPIVPAYPIQSFADFSARTIDAYCGAGYGAFGKPRCFAEMLVCAGCPVEDEGLNVSQAAQYIVRHYNSSLPASPVVYRSSSKNTTKLSRALRVLFITRSPKVAVRHMLNLDDLLEQCQAWKHTDPATGTRFSAECGVWQTGSDLKANIAAIRSADIMIGRHGAAMANGFFMKDGGAMVEVYGPGWNWQLFRGWRDQDNQSKLQWWALSVEDRSLLDEISEWHPNGYRGSQGNGKKIRDTNMRVPWEGLTLVLQEVAGVHAAGGLPAYQVRRARNETVNFLYGGEGDISQGPIWGW